MPAKQVTQFECDRCERVWYEDINTKPRKRSLELSFDMLIPRDPEKEGSGEVQQVVNVKYDCVCDACATTCNNLVKQIAKEFAPRKPRAKKEETATNANTGPAGKGAPSPTDPDSIKTPSTGTGAPPQAPSAPKLGAAPSGASSGTAASRDGKGSPGGSSRPTTQ